MSRRDAQSTTPPVSAACVAPRPGAAPRDACQAKTTERFGGRTGSLALIELRSVVTLARLRFEHLAVLGLAEIAGERADMLSVRGGVVDHVELPLAAESEQFAPDPERNLKGRLRRLDPQDRLCPQPPRPGAAPGTEGRQERRSGCSVRHRPTFSGSGSAGCAW